MGVDTSCPCSQARKPRSRITAGSPPTCAACPERNLPRADRLAQLLSSEARRPAAPVRHLRTPGRARRAADVHQRDHTGEAIGELEGQPLYHGSLDRQEYRDLLEANGFEVVRYVEWDEECGRANVWLARRGGAVEGETRQPRITAVPARSVAVDEVLRIPDEPGDSAFLPRRTGWSGAGPRKPARCSGFVPREMAGCGSPCRRAGAGVRAGGERCGCDCGCGKNGAQCPA